MGMGKSYFRVTFNPETQTIKGGKRSFWMEVIRETPNTVWGWEMDSDGRTHKQHIIMRDAATFQPARMNHTYAEMEIIK